jgi:hypothetical protein
MDVVSVYVQSLLGAASDYVDPMTVNEVQNELERSRALVRKMRKNVTEPASDGLFSESDSETSTISSHQSSLSMSHHHNNQIQRLTSQLSKRNQMISDLQRRVGEQGRMSMTPHVSRGYSKHHLPPHPDRRRPLSTSLHNLTFRSTTAGETVDDDDFTAQWLATSNLPLSITTTSHDNLMSMPKGLTPNHHGMMTPSTSFHSQTEEEILNAKGGDIMDDGRLTRDDLEPDKFAALPNAFHNSPRQNMTMDRHSVTHPLPTGHNRLSWEKE